jgi:hypothetical protein
MGWDASDFTASAAAVLEDGVADRQTLEQVAAARGLSFP